MQKILIIGCLGNDKKMGSPNHRALVYVDTIKFLDSRSHGKGESMPDESAEQHKTSSEDVSFRTA